jgi:hypothetical protein
MMTRFEAMGSLLLPFTATGVSLLTVGGLIGAPLRGQPWTTAVTLLQWRHGLRARQMAVWWTFRELSQCRHVRRACMRNAGLDCTPSIPTTVCHQSHDVEIYSRYTSPYSACP